MAIGVTRESPRWYTFTMQINITYIGQFEALLQGLIFFRLNVGSQLLYTRTLRLASHYSTTNYTRVSLGRFYMMIGTW